MYRLERAGRYTAEDVKAKASYYDDDESTVAIPCATVEALSILVAQVPLTSIALDHHVDPTDRVVLYGHLPRFKRPRVPCPLCGSANARAHNRKTGVCERPKSCNERRCRRRKEEDDKRAVREQCHGTYGKTSVRFCELRVGHEGPHLHATHEWTGDFEHPVAQVLRARSV